MSGTIAVTGGTGYIAGFVIAEFLNRGYTVRASVRGLSKIASEKAAWAFAAEHGVALTTILPGAVFGQVMSAGNISSNDILLRLINGGMPRALNVPLEVSNVRDLAALHRLAFESDKAVGERFLAASQTIRTPEAAWIYREQYSDSKTPAKVFPNWTVRFLSMFIPSLRSMVPMLGREYSHTTEKAERLLGRTQHTPRGTLLDAAASFGKLGMIK